MYRAVAIALLMCAASLHAAEKPLNILLITADDLGPMLSCYGDRTIRTPHIDALAESGTRFEVAYVAQASCSPSRSAMFTGLYPHSTGQYGLTNTGLSLHEHLHDRVLPDLLKKAGYRTGLIGKLHVAPENKFDFDMRGKGSTRDVANHVEVAREFIAPGKSVDADKPFFLMFNFTDPHAARTDRNSGDWHFPAQIDGLPKDPLKPGEAPPFYFQQINTEPQLQKVANYYNCVLRVDAGMGMLMKVLEETGHADDTLVIFTGDHGPPFARGKTSCYEGGLRVPFIVRWPGVSKPMVSKAMVSTVDIVPTALDAAGQKTPDDLHGRSLRPVVSNPNAEWREYLAAEFHMHGSQPFYPRRAIRDGRYKLIHNLLAGEAKPSTGIDGDKAYAMSQEPPFKGTAVDRAFDTFADPPEYELYDLQNDPAEFYNLAGKADVADVQKRLTAALMQWRKQTDDPFLDRAMLKKFQRPGPGKRN